MSNPNQRLKIVNLEINGQKLSLKEVGSLDLGGVARESEAGNERITFSEKPMPAMIEASIYIHSGIDIQSFNKMNDVTAVATADSGHIYVLTNAWTEESTVINPSDGTLAVKFVANKAAQVAKG